MYGKHFSTMYEGSMVGAGAVVFAVWGYCIAKACPDNHTVLLNPMLLAPILGETVVSVEHAISFLTSPDKNSKNKEHEGRRLLNESGFLYFVVSHAHYRNMKTQADVREHERVRKMKYREQKSNVPVVPICPGQNGTPVSVSVSASVSDSSSKRGSAEGEVQIKVVPGWETEFEECWALYPDKSGKAKARAAYQKAHKEGVTQEQVLMGLNRYAWWLDQKRSGGFKDLKAKNGATWFGQQCWQDEYTVEDRRKHEKPRFE